jgi:hypothetical protein
MCILNSAHHLMFQSKSGILSLQLGRRGQELLNVLEAVEEIEALGVEQGAAGLDGLARDDLLDGKLDLFAVDGCLFCVSQSVSQSGVLKRGE